jgi:hypothetical protein
MTNTPLPPRPSTKNTPELEPEDDLDDRVLVEQRIGSQNVNAANKRLEEEFEAGRKLVERYKRTRPSL